MKTEELKQKTDARIFLNITWMDGKNAHPEHQVVVAIDVGGAVPGLH